MNCSNCSDRYTKNNKPLSLPCGHSFCSRCLSQKIPKCFKCSETGVPKLNQALYEIVLQDRHCQIDKFVKVCFFGQSAVGKTSVINRLAEQRFLQSTITTVGLDFRFKDKQVKDKNIRFQLWDSAGQQQFRAITPNHYRNADIVVLVYSLVSLKSDNDIPYWMNEVQKYTSTKNVIVLGNKHDLADQNSRHNSISQDDVLALDAKNWKMVQVSCKTSHNFDKIWQMLMEIGYNVKRQQKASLILQNKQSKIRNLARSNNGRQKPEQNNQISKQKLASNIKQKPILPKTQTQELRCCIIM